MPIRAEPLMNLSGIGYSMTLECPMGSYLIQSIKSGQWVL